MNRLYKPKYLAAAIGLVFLASSLTAQASSLTSAQVQAIVGLLQSFGADQSTIANVRAALGGSGAASASSCVSLSYDLYGGATDATTGGDVSRLQQFLGISPTGYFGPMTEQAVQQWQSSHAIISSGTPDTTGYGYVGPKTRAAMGCGSIMTTTNGQPSATIDQSSLTTNSTMPTITGEAANVPYVGVYVFTTPSSSAYAKIVDVHDDQWFMHVANSLAPGSYPVYVYGYGDPQGTSEGSTGLIATGTLTISQAR